MADKSLDPDDWPAFRATAHQMLDAALDKMQTATEGRVWTPLPDDLKQSFEADLPVQGAGIADTVERMKDLLPYGVGNTHPRFFGWVHGAGSTSGLVADIAAAAMNANLGGRDHGAMYVEKQVVEWVRQMFDFPDTASGLVVSGTSMATIIALKVARDQHQGQLVGYTSTQAHACAVRAFDLLGLGKDALRLIPVNAAFEMDITALKSAITADRAARLTPFCVVGTAGTVNVGAFDDLTAIADIAATENLWFHVDGAFGASGVLSEALRPKLRGIERADSIAFDFHKWLHVNYDAGFVLVRDGEAHRQAFSDRPEYLAEAARGLAAGNPWPVEYGPELSRGFRALKIWAQINEHGVDRLGQAITRNVEQAKLLERLVLDHPKLEMVAPVAAQIVCFRHVGSDELNAEIVLRLQESGIAAPSTTQINGQLAIRVNITNHRTTDDDLLILVEAVTK
ncbi:MAG: aminotransferase class V-fold PLP-dependent enzyme [Rhodobacteraceae bacterium]|nr:aminotransferase class V-fold PLP-dependent enzyme [Paracoccaceae bacterium]